MANELAIVLCSGGMNSLVAATLAGQRYRTVLLHATRSAEVPASFTQQAEALRAERAQTVTLPVVPGPTEAALPARLADLLPLVALGARLAAKADAAALYLGLRVGNTDALATAMEFVQLWDDLLALPCGKDTCKLQAPLLDLSVEQVGALGRQVDAPLHLAV